MTKTRSAAMHRAALLVGVAIAATLIVPILIGGGDALQQLLDFPARGYLALLAVIATSWLARAAKLWLLLHRVGMRPGFLQILAKSLAIDFAFISTPAGVGGYAACIYYLRRTGASIGAATSVTAADQILDLSFFALILPIAGVTLLWSELPHALALLAFATGASMLAGGVVAALARGRIARWLLGDNILARQLPAFRRRQHILHGFLVSVGANARLLASGGPRVVLPIAALTAVQWLTRYGVLWAALALLGHHVSYALTLLLQALILHAAMWTGVPAGGGGAELGLTAALAAWVPAAGIATALLLWRLVTFDACLVVGLAAALLLGHRRAPMPPHAAPARADSRGEGAPPALN